MNKLQSIALALMVVGATTCLADTYQEGKIALEHKDYAQANTLFSKACDSGDAKGCFDLGKIYENGMGTAENKYKAAALYAQACRGGVSLGCSSMALTHDTP